MKLGILFLLIFFCLAILAPIDNVFAYQISATDVDSDDAFAISPVKFDLTAEAGVKIERRIVIINKSRDDLIFKLSVEDFVASDNGEETVRFLGEESGQKFSLKDYIKPEISDFILAPKEQISFNVNISLPDDITTGSHYAALIASAKRKAADEFSQIESLSRIASLFLLNVKRAGNIVDNAIATDNGSLQKLEVNWGKNKSAPDVQITFRNDNQTHLVLNGGVEINNFLGKKIDQADFNSWYVLPNSARQKTINLSKKLFWGKYSASVKVFWRDGDINKEYQDNKNISFWVLPSKLIIIFMSMTLILLIVLFLLYLKKFKKLFSVFVILILFAMMNFYHIAYAEMYSSNYKIMNESINFGGTEFGKSTNYNVSDSMGEVGGNGQSANYQMFGGTRLPATLSISTASNASMSSCAQSGGCSSSASLSWTVTTDNLDGYSLSISASTNPAMQTSGGTFADFSPTSGTTSFWSVGSTASAFGFSVGTSGQTDILSVFKDNGTNCSAGSTLGRCFRGFNGTTAIQIVSRTTPAVSGNITTVNLQAEIGNNHTQTTGSYSATITATASAL